MYDTFAPDYDHFVNWPERLAFEMPFIVSLLEKISAQNKSPLKILDAACGSGQHAIALAKRGFKVSAADLSAPMIAKARANATEANVAVDFKVAGFGAHRQAFGEKKFDAVLCLGNSLPHLLTPAELLAALQDFSGCLRPGGLLLLQNRNFDAVMKNRQRWMEPQADSDGKTEWLFLRFYDFEANEVIRFNIVMLKRPIGGKWTTSIHSTFLAPLLGEDLANSIAAAGFEDLQTYGSLSGEPFSPLSSENLVVTASSTKYK
jgi:glycine/sarcosine N-methyltransferase